MCNLSDFCESTYICIDTFMYNKFGKNIYTYMYIRERIGTLISDGEGERYIYTCIYIDKYV